jgi:hypothetical protein
VEDVFDQELAQWVPSFVDRVQRLAMDGLRKPSLDASPFLKTDDNEGALLAAKEHIASLTRQAHANSGS